MSMNLFKESHGIFFLKKKTRRKKERNRDKLQTCSFSPDSRHKP
jgi:hypothetical protein